MFGFGKKKRQQEDALAIDSSSVPEQGADSAAVTAPEPTAENQPLESAPEQSAVTVEES